MQKQKGFTIIELIVVIAIIAILASIVLVNVSQYINKGKNSAIKGNMATLLTNAAAYFDTNPGMFGNNFAENTTQGCGTGSPVKTAIASAGGTLTCFGSTTIQDWCGTTPTLAAGADPASTFCVDSTGYKGVLGTGKCTAIVFTCQ